MPRFLLDNNPFNETDLSITDKKEIHHLKNVLRLKANDSINLFNGAGKEAQGTITKISPHRIDVNIQSVSTLPTPKRPTLILACALPKKAKFETIIEKTTELGVDEIYPLQTDRTEVIIPKEKWTNKKTRYDTVATNASKQSNRSKKPHIHPVTKFKAFVNQIDKTWTVYIPCLIGQRKSIKTEFINFKNKKNIVFMIGPEGDFTTEEINIAVKAGCIPLSLGDTTLKVDTAAMSVIAFANFYLKT